MRAIIIILFALLWTGKCIAQQDADTSFDVSVSNPFFTMKHPKILFDEGHQNFHTTTGRYLPFCNLIKNDGSNITANKEKFSEAVLKDYNLLIIANATNRYDSTAFTREECQLVKNWVDKGGSLLLITDHMPFSKMSQWMAEAFSVEFTIGTMLDSTNRDSVIKENSHLVYSRQNGLLADHSITRGVNKVLTFTGQGVKGPRNCIEILKASPAAYFEIIELVNPKITEQGFTAKIRRGSFASANGFSQAIAFNSGKGRVIVTGEAAMLSGQITGGERAGMNYPGVDNKQLVLNMVRWLLGH